MFENDVRFEYKYVEDSDYFYDYLQVKSDRLETGLKSYVDDITKEELLSSIRRSFVKLTNGEKFRIIYQRKGDGWSSMDENGSMFCNIVSEEFPNLPLYAVSKSILNRLCKEGEKIVGYIDVYPGQDVYLTVIFKGRKYYN